MRKVLFVITFSSFLLLSFIFVPNALSQTESLPQNAEIYDESDFYKAEFLKSDLEQTDIVAYINVKQIISAGASDYKTDCVNLTGPGYCSFRLIAEIKELYKGNINLKTIEYYEYGEAESIKNKDSFLGERVVFLQKIPDSEKGALQTLDNSTRLIKFNVVEKMRKIVEEIKSENN